MWEFIKKFFGTVYETLDEILGVIEYEDSDEETGGGGKYDLYSE